MHLYRRASLTSSLSLSSLSCSLYRPMEWRIIGNLCNVVNFKCSTTDVTMMLLLPLLLMLRASRSQSRRHFTIFSVAKINCRSFIRSFENLMVLYSVCRMSCALMEQLFSAARILLSSTFSEDDDSRALISQIACDVPFNATDDRTRGLVRARCQ